eukprot:3607846-Pleurochrysis_carterae.AAC.1
MFAVSARSIVLVPASAVGERPEDRECVHGHGQAEALRRMQHWMRRSGKPKRLSREARPQWQRTCRTYSAR